MKNSFLFTSLDSFSTTDGPYIRFVLFLAKCPLRCVYCHNPETFVESEYKTMTFKTLKRYYDSARPYFKDIGGITFSGGEPLLWAKEILEFKEYMNNDINICIETSANVYPNKYVKELVSNLNSIFVDLKFVNNEDYKKYTNGSFDSTIEFLKLVDQNENLAKNCVIRQVVVPTINDNIEYLEKIGHILIDNFKFIRKVELLPFHDMCVEKYDQFNMEWKLKNIKSIDSEIVNNFTKELNNKFKEIQFI